MRAISLLFCPSSLLSSSFLLRRRAFGQTERAVPPAEEEGLASVSSVHCLEGHLISLLQPGRQASRNSSSALLTYTPSNFWNQGFSEVARGALWAHRIEGAIPKNRQHLQKCISACVCVCVWLVAAPKGFGALPLRVRRSPEPEAKGRGRGTEPEAEAQTARTLDSTPKRVLGVPP